jgi:hypothetical protein
MQCYRFHQDYPADTVPFKRLLMGGEPESLNLGQ